MRTKLAVLFITILCVSSNPVPVQADSDEVFQLRLQIFVITGNMSEDTELEEKIWNGDRRSWRELEGAVTLFDHARFRLGNDILRVNEDGCFWNQVELTFTETQEVDLPEDRIRRIYSPNVLMEKDRSSTIKIQSEEPVEYFVRREDGLFDLRRVQLPTGLYITICPKEKRNRVVLDCMVIRLQVVGEREKIPGVRLPVGRPILRAEEYTLALRIRFHKNYGLLLRPGGGDGIVLVIFNLSAVTPDVVNSVRQELGDVSYDIKRKVRDERVVYEVDSWIDGRHIELNIFPDGTIMSKSEEVSLQELPAPVRDCIQANLGEAELEEIDKVTSAERIVYEVEAEGDGEEIEITVSEDGVLLEKKIDG